MELDIFPWDKGVAPVWINPDTGHGWYLDVTTTEWTFRDFNDNSKLNGSVYFVCEKVDGEITPLTRILIDNETNQPLAEHTGVEDMCVKIDMIRMALTNSKNYD
jgi:hypothetical protein